MSQDWERIYAWIRTTAMELRKRGVFSVANELDDVVDRSAEREALALWSVLKCGVDE